MMTTSAPCSGAGHPPAMSMTLDMFLETYRRIPGWQLEWLPRKNQIAIRLFRRQSLCPLTAVCYVLTGKRWKLSFYLDAADSIGLPRDLAQKIAEAADDEPGCSPEIRGELLAAVA
jgi:hypothetical protein